MFDVPLLMIDISFLMVAFLAAVATVEARPTVRRIANWVIYGCCVAALVSVLLAAWSLFRSPA